MAILCTPSFFGWEGTASFGGDIAGLGAEPLVRRSGAKPPEAESFLFHIFFSEARAEINFDA